MGMAGYIETQLDSALLTYVTSTSSSMTGYAATLAVTLISIYWTLFGYAAMRGDVNEPMSKITKDVGIMLFVAMVALSFSNYQNYVIEATKALVSDMTSRMSGGAANSPGALIDAIFADCVTPPGETKCLPPDTVYAFLAIKHENSIGIPDMSFFIANFLMGLAEIVVVVLCLIPILLSKVAVAVFLAIGPFFIMLAMFPVTRTYFNAWLSATLGNLLTQVIVAGICSVVPIIMQKIINDSVTGDLSGVEVINRAIGAVIAAIGLGLSALKASQMGAQLAGGGVAMDGGNWLGSLGNMVTNLRGGRGAGNAQSDKQKDTVNTATQGAPKPYVAGQTAGRAVGNVLDALSRRK